MIHLDGLKAMSLVAVFDGIIDPMNLMEENKEEASILLESADIVTKLGEKSMLLFDLALKIEARNSEILVRALCDEAKPLLSLLKKSFLGGLIDEGADYIKLYSDPLFHENDLLKKMQMPSALDILRKVLELIQLEQRTLREFMLLTGAFAYDFLDHFERLAEAKRDYLNIPDFLFYLPLSVLTINHKKNTTKLVCHSLENNKKWLKEKIIKYSDKIKENLDLEKAARMSKVPMLSHADYDVDVSDEDFLKIIERCKSHIKAGDVYQIVPSRTFSRSIKNTAKSYRALRAINPSPYMFVMKTPEWTLFGASPETFIKVDKAGSRVAIRPIAGTRRRGFSKDGSIDPELDSREQASLCLDEKELSEHMMLVDLARNDIASVAQPQSRRIKRLLGVDRLSHVMHLVSEVEGKLRDDCDALSAYQASMNMGTLMGAPKVKAAELLRELEYSKRGFYGGAIGYLTQNGNLDSAIIIRSALVKDERAYVRAGCGVVYDSDPHFEVVETKNKAEAVLCAIASTEE
jgi:anthranilate synthase component 1